MPHHNAPQSDPAPSSARGADQAENLGEDVMRVLDQVEDQLNRLRTVRKQQDDTITSLTTRSAALKQAEEHLEQARKDLDRRASELPKQRSEFDEERQRVEALTRQCQKQQKDFADRSARFEAEREELQLRVE